MKPRKHARSVIVKCRSCGWKWIPDPHKWRNNLNPRSSKALRCPKCSVLNIQKKETVEEIERLNR